MTKNRFGTPFKGPVVLKMDPGNLLNLYVKSPHSVKLIHCIESGLGSAKNTGFPLV